MASNLQIVLEPGNAEALSLDHALGEPPPDETQKPVENQTSLVIRALKRADILLVLLLVIGMIGLVVANIVRKSHSPSVANTSATQRFDTVKLPLGGFVANEQGISIGAASVAINGSLKVNDGLIVSPSVQPNAPTSGQLYFDQNTHQLAYYNGTAFVPLTAQSQVVQSIGGATGTLTLGGGLTVVGNQITAVNTGVTSFGGQSGPITIGSGLKMNGSALQNGGAISIAAGNNISVTSDGNGNYVINNTGAGTGTVTSSGSSAGHIALLDSAQNITDSLITQSGTTVTVTGDLNVVTGGLSLGNALTVSNGGTGATSLADNGVVVAHGTAAFTSVTAGSAGLCLLSTVGAPAWGACPGNAGVTTLNGLSGVLTLANASGSGATVTIDDAGTGGTKGIASFNATNFNVAGGIANTIQDINTTAAPTFGRLTITSSQAGNPMLLVNNTNTSATGNLLDLQLNGSSKFSVQPGGNVAATGTINGQTISNAANFTGSLGVAGNTILTGTLAVNGGTLSSSGALNITPGGALTVGTPGQTLALQGNGSSTIAVTGGGNTTTVSFQAPTANVTYRFPTAPANTYDICTTAGNCTGVGGGVTTAGGTANTLAKFTAGQVIGNSTISDDGTTVTTTANIAIQGGTATVGVANAQTGSLTLAYGAANFSGTVTQGGLTANRTYTLPDQSGTICLSSGNCLGGASGGANTALSNLTSVAINTSLLPGATSIDLGSGTAPFRELYIAGSSASPGTNNFKITGAATAARTITLPDSSGTVCLNNSTNCGFLTGTGTAFVQNGNTLGATAVLGTTDNFDLNLITHGNTVLGLTAAGSATFGGDVAINGTTLSSAGALNITPAGTLTVGVTNQALTLQGNASAKITATGGGFTTTVGFSGTPVGAVTYNFDRSATGGPYTICSTAGNCSGAGGGVTTSGGSIDRVPKFTGSQTIGDSSISDNGTTVSTTGNLTVQGGTVTAGVANSQTGILSLAYGSANFSGSLSVGTLTANRTYTLPDQSGTICLSSGNCLGGGGGGANTALSNLSSVAINTSLLPGATTIDLGSATAPFRNLYLAGSSVTPASNNFTITGTATAARTITLPDATGTVCLNASASCGFATGSGSAFTQNGNSFGATGVLGTNDTNGLNIRTNGNTALGLATNGDATFAANVAINGATLSSAGALSITPGSTLTVGAPGQTLTLQGNASTTISATGGGFTTTVGFTGSPAANVNYNFDRTVANGSYTICSTIGNCAGTGTGVTTAGGTAGTIAVFTGTQAIGNSLLSQSGSTVTINGNVSLSTGHTFQINSTQISSADLSNDSNLAKLSASQTFTGATNSFKNAADSTNAFNVQNTGGNKLLTADTTNGAIILGTASALDGKLVFTNMSNAHTATIAPGTPTLDRTITLPDASGIICLDSGNCAGAGATLQTAYNFSVGGTTPKVKLNSTLNGFDVQDADTTIGVDLFDVRASNNAGLGSVLFGVGNTGQVTLKNSVNSTTALSVLTQGGTKVLTIDTTSGLAILGQGGTLAGSLVFSNATNTNLGTLKTAVLGQATTYTLPDPGAGSATICLNTGNCLGGGGGGANTALSNLSSVAINTTLLPGAAGTINLGSGALPFGDIYLAGTSGTPGTNNFKITGASTSGTRTLTLPDATGTVCLQGVSACGFATGSGSAFVQGGNSFTAAANLGTNDTFDLNLRRGGSTVVTVGAANVTLANNIDLLLQGATAYISNPQSGTATEAFGQNASVQNGAQFAVAVGANSSAATRSIAVGEAASAEDSSVALGSGATTGAVGAIAIGYNSNTGTNAGSIAIGVDSFTTAANQLVVGAGSHPISQVVIGNGVANAAPLGFTLQATGGSGADVAGASTNIAGGQSTGAGNGGNVNIQISKPSGSSSTPNSLTTVATFSGSTGALSLQNAADSSAAFKIVNAANTETVLTVDTTPRGAGGGNLVKIGNSTGTDTALTILQLDAATAAPTSNLAALNGGLFYNSTTNKVSLIENGQVKIICNTTDLGCGTGTVSLQNAYNNSTGGATSEVILDAARAALDVQDRSTSNGGTIGANLLNVRATAATDSAAGAILFGIGNTGAALFQNSSDSTAALQVKNANASATVFDIDTTNQRVGINTTAPSSTFQVNQTSLTPGTVSNSAASPNVTGSSTTFLTTFQPGDTFTITSTTNTCTVKQITSDTALVCVSNLANLSSVSAYSFTAQTRLSTTNDGRTTTNGTLNFNNPATQKVFTAKENPVSGNLEFSANTVGKTAPGNAGDQNANFIMSSMYNSGSGGSINALRVYFRGIDGSNPHFKVAVYADSSGSPGSLLSSPTAPTTTGVVGWNTASLGSTITLTPNTNYWLSFSTESGGTGFSIQSGGGTSKYQSGFTYTNNFPGTFTVNSSSADAISVYATYLTVTDQSAAGAALSINDNNEVTVKPNYDSATAFAVQSTAGANILSVDTFGQNVNVASLVGTSGKFGGFNTAGNYTVSSLALNSSFSAGMFQGNASATAPVVVLQAGGSPGAAADILQLQDTNSNVNAKFNNAGNQLTLGRIAGSGTVTQGKLVLSDGTTDNFGATINTTGSLTASSTFQLGVTGANGTYQICSTLSVCTGYQASGSYANTALSNLASVAINAALGFQSNQTATINFNGSAATGNALNITGQTATGAGNLGGGVTIQGGNAAATGVNGSVTVDTGTGASASNGSVLLGNTNAATVTIGNTTAATVVNIKGGVGASSGGINIGTTSSSTVTIGSNSSSGNSVSIESGSGNSVAIGNAANSSHTILIATNSDGATTQAVTIGNNNNVASVTTIQGGNSTTAAINLTPSTAGGIMIGAASGTGTITLGQSSGTNTVNIGAAATTNTQTIAIGTGATSTGKDNVTIGSTNSSSTTIIQGGTGNISLNSGASTIVKPTTDSNVAFEVQNSGATNLVNVNTLSTPNQVLNGDFETLSTNGWSLRGTAFSMAPNDAVVKFGRYSLAFNTNSVGGNGIQYLVALRPSTQYSMSWWARRDTGSAASFNFGRAENGSDTDCLTNQTLNTTWTQFTCTFTTGATVAATSNIYLKQTDTSTDLIYLDGITLVQSSVAVAYATPATGLQVDGSFANTTINGTNVADVQPWQLNPTSLPGNRARAGTVVANGYVYVLGGGTSVDGQNVVSSGNVLYAKINADGTLGTWTTNANNLQTAVAGGGATVVNGYIYLMGGKTGNSDTTGVTTAQYAKLNADGSTGAWQAAGNGLLAPRNNGAVQALNGYIYYMGGMDTTSSSNRSTYYTRVNADGTLGQWQTGGGLAFGATGGYFGSATWVANGYIYATSPDNSNHTISYGKPDNTGNISWTANPINAPDAMLDARAVAMNGYAYLFGGYNNVSVTRIVYYAPLNDDGTVGDWLTSNQSLPDTRENMGTVTANGYIYLIGGDNNGGAAQTSTYYTTTSRLRVGGGLDLVGLSGKTLADAGSGGQLTAGNTTVVGSLQVSGDSAFAHNVNVLGQINVAGQAAFQSATNSTSAFQIQDASNNSLLNVDSSNSNISLLAADSPNIGTFTSTTSLTAARYGGTTVAYNGYVYYMGGTTNQNSTGAYHNDVYYAKINSNGTVGTFAAANSVVVPPATAFNTYKAAGVAANGYLYYIGGYDNSNARGEVLYAKINSDGSLGSWQQSSNSLPTTGGATGRSSSSAVYLNGYIYLIGGYDGNAFDSTAVYAKVNADGSTGAWTITSSWGATAAARTTAVVANGTIYVMGGSSDNTAANSSQTVYYAVPNTSTGAISSWSTSANSLPAKRFGGTSVISNGYVYYMGGMNNVGAGAVTNTIYYAKLANGGDTGAWQSPSFTVGTAAVDAGTAMVNGYIYQVGGNTNTLASPTAISTVAYASASRVQIGAASLDLVGLQGASSTADPGDPSTGSYGGSLTAGNGTFVGTLEVQGAASFSQAVAISGNLTVDSILSVDVARERVTIGPAAGDTVGALLVLGSKTNAGDPTGVNGAMYYNASSNTFRCYAGGTWGNCAGAGGAISPDTFRQQPFYSTDFMGIDTTQVASGFSELGAPWYGGWINSAGSVVGVAGVANHPGIARMQSAGVANSGWFYETSTSAVLLSGNETFEAVFRAPSSWTNTTVRIGFLDTASVTAPTDGAWLEITGGTVTAPVAGKTSNGGGANTSTTGTTGTVTVSLFYRVKITVDSTASTITYALYNDGSSSTIWTDTLTTNIPKTAGHETGIGVVATNLNTGQPLIDMDYMAVWLSAALSR